MPNERRPSVGVRSVMWMRESETVVVKRRCVRRLGESRRVRGEYVL